MRSTAANIASLLARTAGAWPRLPALAAGREVLADYATLALRAAQGAGWMAALGLFPGDRIALVARNVPAYIEALFACWWAGLVAVPVNAKLHPREAEFILDDSGAALALVDGAWHAVLGGMSTACVREAVRLDAATWSTYVASSAPVPIAPVAADDPAWLF